MFKSNKCFSIILFALVCLDFIKNSNCRLTFFSKNERIAYREKIRTMFYEAYDSYVANAIDYDELMPISCSGMNTWGTFSLSLIDALDMLAILDNHTEFRRVAQHILETADFETNTNVSVFETNIRVVGGLLSAHLLSRRAEFRVEDGWPCSGPLLRLAEKVARKLLPAFDTPTGMPYGTVNFRYGVPENETPVTCTAGVGTFIVEFGTLSRLIGDPIFEETALRAIEALQKFRSKIGLLGNHINVIDGKWTATDAGIGAGVDSYFEYLVKGSMLLQMPNLMEIFYYDYKLIRDYFKKNDWFIWVSMITGSATMPIFQSLEAFFPGLLTLIGELDQAKKTLYNYHQVWKQYGFVPEFYDIVHGKHYKREGYPLRPEFIESVFYLYRATKDTHLLSIGADVVDSIYYSARTECGYATIKSVSDHTIEDRMESFFLAETLKYLFLLFDEDNFINENGSVGVLTNDNDPQKGCVVESGGYVFNTEAHPIDIAAVTCCKQVADEENFIENNLNLYDILVESRNEKFADYKVLEKNEIWENNYGLLKPKLDTIDYFSKNQVAKDDHPETEINTRGQKKSLAKNVLSESFLIKFENGTHCSQTLALPNSIQTIPMSSIHQISNITIDPNKTGIPLKNRSPVIMDTIELLNQVDDIFFRKKNEKFNFHYENDYELLSCPSQSFLIRLSLYGQMFE